MKKYIPLFLLIGCSYSYATTAHDNYSAHDNYVCMDENKSNYFQKAPIKFSLDSSNSYSITSGQPFGGVSNVSYGNEAGCVDVYAGRSNSTQNVTWVQAQENNISDWWHSNYMVNTVIPVSDPTPTALNFAIQGTLQITANYITYTCPHTILGQGHNGYGNNWWIFSNENAYENGWTNSLYCYGQSGAAYRIVIEPSAHQNVFEIDAVVTR